MSCITRLAKIKTRSIYLRACPALSKKLLGQVRQEQQ
jgi:hypothetical protein